MDQLVRNPWPLIEGGQYEQAIEAYSRLYAEDGRLPNLRNRATAYKLLGDYAAALRDYSFVVANETPRFAADGDYINQGVCYWHLGQPLKTVAVWRQSLTCPYTDAAGGVVPPALLLYAAERLGDGSLRKEAVQLLRKHARRKLGAWPGPIVPFLLGKTEVAELAAPVNAAGHPHLFARWKCQAEFYIALRALREGDSATFRNEMMAAADSDYGFLEEEFYLAKWEVASGFPDIVTP